MLAASIVLRLQTIVSREIAPSQTAVLTIGSCQAGTKGNVIPDHAVLQLNLRSYSQQTRQQMMDAIQRIVRAECQTAGSPQDPDFETLDGYPLTDNEPDTTRRVAAAFGAHFGDRAVRMGPADRQRGLQYYSPGRGHPVHLLGHRRHRPADVPHRREGRAPGRHAGNHSPKFLPVLQPTLRTGTEALTTAALAWLAPHSGS